MPRRISQRELRNEGGRIMRALVPLKPRVFVQADTAVGAFRQAPRLSGKRLCRDLDALVNQDPTPRG